MEFNNRRSVCDDLSKYTYSKDKDSFIEVTEWTNGEGFDINICDKSNDQFILLSRGEIEAINHLINMIDHEYPHEESGNMGS